MAEMPRRPYEENMTTLHTLAATESARQDIRKSRFLAVAGQIDSEAGAKAFITAHCDPSANHNCWAWRLGQTYRFSDDGEPSGTAGKPILQAIDGQSLDRVAVVVTRWFGGVLLGGGGLIRAYGGTAAICLRTAAKTPLIETAELSVTCLFPDLALVKARLGAMPAAQVKAEKYTDTGGELTVSIPLSELEQTLSLIADLTSGRAVISTSPRIG
ncbi:IMPACT family protein [Aquamicrobium ahrensii]|uniref:YigZ family protein n=1 Tax=Aquamicrobium ahrensii TaxID=469551 RepID=A0ABV2KQH3_9HYPH